MHDNLIREREGGRLPLEVVSGLSFGFSGSPCFFRKITWVLENFWVDIANFPVLPSLKLNAKIFKSP